MSDYQLNPASGASDAAVDIAERAAGAIVARGLEVPAVFFLELHKPLLTLVHTASLACEPIAAPLFGAERLRSLNSMLADREAVELLIDRIEALSAAKSSCLKASSASKEPQ